MGPGFWKFNASLLDDSKYISEVDDLLDNLIKEEQKHFANKNTFWEWTKYRIRKHAITFSKHKASVERNEIDELQKKIKDLHTLMAENPSDEKRISLASAEKKLEELYDKKSKGAIFRSKVQWYEEGEKCTKFFLNLDKCNYISGNH